MPELLFHPVCYVINQKIDILTRAIVTAGTPSEPLVTPVKKKFKFDFDAFQSPTPSSSQGGTSAAVDDLGSPLAKGNLKRNRDRTD